MGAGKVLLIILGTLGAMTVGTCAVCSLMVGGAASAVNEAREERQIQARKKSDDAKRCKEGQVLEWSTIKVDIEANEAKVAAAWKGSCAKIKGVVASIGSGLDDAPYVVIDDGEAFSVRNLHCKPGNASNALALTKGQQITVWGVGGSEIMGSLMLEHCDW